MATNIRNRGDIRNIASENHDIQKYFNLLYMINNISHVKI